MTELRRKWRWANWLHERTDKIEGEAVAPDNWIRVGGGPGYTALCLWVALLRSVHEGLTESLDSFDTPKPERVDPAKVLPVLPQSIREFPVIKGSPFRDFRNAVFHCQWSPTLAKFDLDDETCLKLEALHAEMGQWIEEQLCTCFAVFKKKYTTPRYWVYDPVLMDY